MAKIKNFIEINGKRYDALTGVLVVAGGTPTVAVKVSAAEEQISKLPKTPSHKSVVTKTAKGRAVRPVTAHAPARARTLMRRSVAKPAPSLKRHFKAIASIDALTPQPTFNLKIKASVLSLDDKRLRHAQHVLKSKAISRFGQGLAQPSLTPIKVSVSTPQPHPVNHYRAASKAKRPKTTAELLELALSQATGHLEPPVEPARHRRLWHRKAASAH